MKTLAVENPCEDQMGINDSAEARKNYLERTVVRISVTMLGVGFSLLGFLSLVKNHHVCSETGISLEDAFSIFGGVTSFLLGGIFLIAGALHWNRPETNS